MSEKQVIELFFQSEGIPEIQRIDLASKPCRGGFVCRHIHRYLGDSRIAEVGNGRTPVRSD